ncbi:MAG: YIP1 family protein [Candidatus Aureabacteria bacterium]|nr:YIP1 family protein [Candidatus Auribacterota bacterium]
MRFLSGVNAWNSRGETGFFRSFIISACRVASEPFVFFNSVKAEISLWPAFLFCFTVFLLAALIRFAAYELSGFIGASLFFGSTARLPEFLFGISASLIAPLKMLLITVLKASVLHLCALLFGGRSSVGATFRVVFYSSVSYFALLLPVAGVLVSLCWEMWLYMEGLHVVHDMPRSRSAWAVMFPALMVMLLLILGLLTFFSLAA